jgi:hypothetical protein
MKPAFRRDLILALLMLAVFYGVAGYYAWVSHESGQSFRADSGGWYGELSRSFQQGRLSLLSEPSPGLRADPHPYGTVHNYPYKWDISYYHGKYYLYFGLTPEILLFYPCLLLTGNVLNQTLAYWLICLAALLVYGLFLRRIVQLYFPATPVWVQALLFLLFGMVNLQAFMIHLAMMYEIAAMLAATCLLAMFYFLLLSLSAPQRRAFYFGTAAFFWAAAIGSRPSSMIYGAALAVVFWHFSTTCRPRELVACGLAALVPVVLYGGVLAWYNEARFGHWTDFGFGYQLSGNDYQQAHVRLVYGPIGLLDYLFMPPRISPHFPFLLPKPPYLSFFNPHLLSTRYAGLFVTCPLFFYAAAALSKKKNYRLLAWAIALPSLATLLLLSCYFAIGYRYFIDFTVPFSLLMSLGLLAVLSEGRFYGTRRSIFIGVAVYSLLVSFLISLSGEYNGLNGSSPWVNRHYPGIAPDSESRDDGVPVFISK